MTMSLAAMMMLGAQASVAAAAAREQSLAWLSSILETQVELNDHGAIELTKDQINRLKAAAPLKIEYPDPTAATWTGIPIWRIESEDQGHADG